MNKRRRRIRPVNRVNSALAMIALVLTLEQAFAQSFVPLGKAVHMTLRPKDPKNVPMRTLRDGKKKVDVFYTRSGGRVTSLAFVQKGLFPPDCTHTWVVGVDPVSYRVKDIHVVEMSCAHAYPTNTKSFLGQFKGLGPADAAKIKSVVTVAKATGSSELAKDAVLSSVTLAKTHAKKLK